MFFLWFLNDQMDGGKSGATARSPIGTYPGRMVGCCVILWALLAVNSQLSGVDIFHVNQCRSSFYYSTDSTDSTPYLENKIRSVQSNLCFISVAFRGHCLHPPDISRYLQVPWPFTESPATTRLSSRTLPGHRLAWIHLTREF